MTTKKQTEEEVPTINEDEEVEVEETVIVPSFGNLPGPGDGTHGGSPDSNLPEDD